MSRFARGLLLSALLAAPAVAQTADVIKEAGGLIEKIAPLPQPPAVEPSPKDRSLRPLFPPQKPLPAEQVKPLVEALGSKDYKTREKASRDLLAADDRVLPHLVAALEATDDPEVERRLEVIVERIRRDRAVKPTRVSVKAKGLSAKTVLKDVCRQAGYTLTGEVGEGAKVTLDLDGVPFWEAVERVCEPLGLSAEASLPTDDRGVLNVYAADATNPFTRVSGPFRFVATSISSSKGVQLSGLPRQGGSSPASEYMNLSVSLYSEPKVPVIAVGPVRLTRAVDDKGESMIEPGAELPGESAPLTLGGYYRSLNQSLAFNLVRGSKEATVLKEVRGVVPVLMLVDVKAEAAIDDILTVKKTKFACRSCDLEVKEVTAAEGGLVEAKVVFTPRVQPADGDDYSWWSTLPQRLVLTDESGVRFVNNGTSEQQQGPGAVAVTVQFTPPPDRRKLKPATLLLTYWVTAQKDVEFSFKDVPLP